MSGGAIPAPEWWKPDTAGSKRPTAAMMNGLTGHGARAMNIFRRNVTDPIIDADLCIVIGITGMVLSLLFPPSRYVAFMACLSAANLLNGWRLHRKLRSARHS
jgi:hypothetical protein